MRICDNCENVIPRPKRYHSDEYHVERKGASKYDVCDDCQEQNDAEDDARMKTIDAITGSRIKKLKNNGIKIMKKHKLTYDGWLGGRGD